MLAPHLVGADGIDLIQLRGHSLCLVDASAHHGGRGVVKLAQIGQRIGAARIQADGLFHLGADSLGELEGAQK